MAVKASVSSEKYTPRRRRISAPAMQENTATITSAPIAGSTIAPGK
jgi:hypothetical protein